MIILALSHCKIEITQWKLKSGELQWFLHQKHLNIDFLSILRIYNWIFMGFYFFSLSFVSLSFGITSAFTSFSWYLRLRTKRPDTDLTVVIHGRLGTSFVVSPLLLFFYFLIFYSNYATSQTWHNYLNLYPMLLIGFLFEICSLEEA